MKKALFFPLQISLCAVGYLWATGSNVQAQVTTDGTVNTIVTPNGNVAEITGGETRDSNLFHSFQEFSVGTGNEAFFNNANDISNIFSRVTGGNISNIDGLIRANGSASLFLINPAGIIFGENASLSLGGSFYGSSASSILFENGEFSAADLENPPLLTVNAPIGLGFRDNPGEIVNRSFAQNSAEEFVGLEVNQGNSLAFIGGNINFEAGEATARGGNIYLGGLSAAGIVDINEDGSLNFPEDLATANISLTNGADIDVRGAGGGNITINAQNLNLEAGESGSSFIRSGIRSDSTSAEAQAGDIAINVVENITLDDSRIINQVNSGGVGNSGNITITTGSLEAINGGDVSTNTFGQGNAGAVEITATGDLTFDGEDSAGFPSNATSQVNSEAVGNAGGVTISTGNLTLTNGGRVSADAFGQGNAGTVNITATGDLAFDGETSGGFPSGATSRVNSNAVGDAGGVTISTNNLTLTNGARVSASTLGEGNAGAVNITATGDLAFDGENSEGFPSSTTSQVNSNAVGDAGGVSISTNNLTFNNGGRVDASTFGQGNAGAVEITATGDLTFDGEDSGGFSSGATSRVNSNAVGDAGGVTISTNNLTLTNGGRVDASTLGQGNAGAVEITATGDLTFDGEDSGGFSSGATSRVNSNAVGDAGGVTISTNNLTLTNGARVDASTFGQGDAGAVNITAIGDLNFDGEDSEGFQSGVNSRVNSNAVGNAGGVTISTNNLTLTNGARVDASTFGQGNAGAVEISATGDLTFDGENSGGSNSGVTSLVNSNAVGESGGVIISTNNLTLTNGGRVAASTFGLGDSGFVDIIAANDIDIDGASFDGFSSGITSNVESEAEGNSGGVNIATDNLSLTNGGQISASTLGQGNAGSIVIDAANDIDIDGESFGEFGSSGIFSQIFPEGVGNAGNIDITTSNLVLTNGSAITASTFGLGDAGKIDIVAVNDINIDGASENENLSTTFFSQESTTIFSQVGADAKGNAGNINIMGTNISLTNGGKVSASTLGQGDAGSIKINAVNDIDIDGASLNKSPSSVTSSIESDAEGNAGDIDITTSNLVLTNGGIIFAGTLGSGDGGNIAITSDFISIDGNSSGNGLRSGVFSLVSSDTDTERNAGDIDITTSNLVLTNGSAIDASTFGSGDGGNIEINSNIIDLLDNAEINANSDGDGISGSIFIQATDLELDNSFISATSRSANSSVSAGNTNLQIEDILSIVNDSSISTEAFDNANAGNITIDAEFIVGRQNLIQPLFTAAEKGDGGNINITAKFIIGLNLDVDEQNESNGFVDTINQPEEILESKQTVFESCYSNRVAKKLSNLTIKGKGGIPPTPDSPLDSHNISINGNINPTSAIPQPIETSYGKIQPARGIKVTKDGAIVLTAYRTNNSGDRLIESSINCGGV